MPLKKTAINSSLFPNGDNDGLDDGNNASGSHAVTTTTEDVTAPSSYHERSNETSRAASLYDGNTDKIHLVEFDENDPEDPFNWLNFRKWVMTILLCSMTMMIGLSITAYSSGISSMVKELNTSNEVGQVGLFCFNLFCAIIPLFVAPFCELTGSSFYLLGRLWSFYSRHGWIGPCQEYCRDSYLPNTKRILWKYWDYSSGWIHV